jgi:23S rRNA (pseudouridine1915-N3)-methyltransferase
MRLIIAAVGRLKSGPEQELVERYRGRAVDAGRRIGLRDVEIVEIKESRASDVGRRMLEESIALANIIPAEAAVVVLDEHGSSLDSRSLAVQLQTWRDAGRPALTFVIGGADGLASEIKKRASLMLAFGAATWPHQLLRIMLLEQIYRVVTILGGHPYHRQ